MPRHKQPDILALWREGPPKMCHTCEYYDSVGVGLLAPAISRATAVRYLTYENAEPEAVEVGLLAPTVSRKTEVRYLAYSNGVPESVSVGLLAPTISRRTYPVYSIPEESISVGLTAPTIKRTNT